MSRCLHCGRPIPARELFCRRWWALLFPGERAEAGTPTGLVGVAARQALDRLEATSATPSEVAD